MPLMTWPSSPKRRASTSAPDYFLARVHVGGGLDAAHLKPVQRNVQRSLGPVFSPVRYPAEGLTTRSHIQNEMQPYSARMAIAGSTRAARRAGMNAAASATASSRIVMPANVRGSRGFTS